MKQLSNILTSIESEERDVLRVEIEVEDLKEEVEKERIKYLTLYDKNKENYYGEYGWLRILDIPKSLHENYKISIESYRVRLKIIEKRRKKLARTQSVGLGYLFDGIIVSKLNWELLEGCTFEKIYGDLVKYYSQLSKLDEIDFSRLEKIVELNPCEVYLGANTFKGFICFRFHKTKVVLLEKPVYGNATYLISKDWESLSRFSRSSLLTFFPEVVSRCIHKDADAWFNCVKAGLSLKSF
ncbi:hypothetical protein H6F75_06485 [Nodosilinea sp. FACHB-131]|uniref:hypothetical protein n=1 Tax=Cyanophyceae TaxID=3028117 RepID=UPI0016826D0B|nr:hypothetical protein [Nodosilinea sp. FACHB-131]MBD1873122.1 hypothetical protein [Nodosilinea sp. FACHB-131]